LCCDEVRLIHLQGTLNSEATTRRL
jgi:hypothetical protein